MQDRWPACAGAAFRIIAAASWWDDCAALPLAFNFIPDPLPAKVGDPAATDVLLHGIAGAVEVMFPLARRSFLAVSGKSWGHLTSSHCSTLMTSLALLLSRLQQLQSQCIESVWCTRSTGILYSTNLAY